MLHRIMVPPNARGNVTFIAPEGQYSIEDKVLELDFNGTKKVSWAHMCCLWRSQGAACNMGVIRRQPWLLSIQLCITYSSCIRPAYS